MKNGGWREGGSQVRGRRWRGGIISNNFYPSAYTSGITSTHPDKYSWQQLIVYFQMAGGEDFEHSQQKQMLSVGGDGYANCPGVNIVHYVHVLECHDVSRRNHHRPIRSKNVTKYENITYQNFCDAAQVIVRGKLTVTAPLSKRRHYHRSVIL